MTLLLALALATPYHDDAPDASVRWRTLTTEHFAIHYMAEDRRGRPIDGEAYARTLAARADTVLRDAAQAVGTVPLERIQVLVVDDVDTARGYTLPHADWIVLSAHPGQQLWRTRGRSDGPIDALAHELGHLLVHKASLRLPEALNLGVEVGGTLEGPWGGAGLRVELDHDRPYGWSEGLAEWVSEQAGVNTWTPERDAWLRATALEGRFLSWAELQVDIDKDDLGDAERAYQEGYAFARWLADRYGPDVHRRMLAAKGVRGWDGALKVATGQRGAALHDRFVAETTAHHRAQADARTGEGLAEGEEVLSWRPPWRPGSRWQERAWAKRGPRDQEEARESTGSWRLCPQLRDGWLLEGRVGAVVASRIDEGSLAGIVGGWTDAPERREELSGERLWIPARFGAPFAHGPGGAWVIGPDTAPWLDADTFDHVWWVDLSVPDGDSVVDRPAKKRRTQLPGTERAMDLAPSPDGTRLALLRFTGGGQELVVGPADGSAWRVWDRWGGERQARGLTWSPDGQHLATSLNVAGQVDLWTLDGPVDGGASWRALTDDRWVEQEPWWDEAGLWFSADLPVAGSEGTRIRDVLRADVLDSDDGPALGEVVRVTAQRLGAACPSTTDGGHLLYSVPGAYGVKAHALGRWAMHGARVGAIDTSPDHEGLAELLDHTPAWPPPRELPRDASVAERPYRAARSLLPPSAAPFARIDVSGNQISPSLGAYATVSDAAEHHDLAVWAMVGDDRALEGRYALQRFWPELGVWGSTVRERVVWGDGQPGVRALDRAAAFVSRGLTEDVSFEVEGQVLAAERRTAEGDGLPRLVGLRGTASLSVDTLGRGLDDQGVRLDLGWTVADSRLAAPVISQGERLEAYRWHRPWGRVRGQRALGQVGPLSDGPHRLELRAEGGWTSRHVVGEEQLAAGGDTPWALRQTALVGTAPLPGYAPYAIRGDALAVAGAAWALPIAPRWRTGGRGLYLRRVELLAGGDAALVWRTEAGAWSVPEPLGDVRAGLRLASVLRDSRFDSQLLVAVPLVPVGEGPSPLGPVPAASNWDAPVRVLIGVGTGW